MSDVIDLPGVFPFNATLDESAPPYEVVPLYVETLKEVQSAWRNCPLTDEDIDHIVCAFLSRVQRRIRRGESVLLEYICNIEPRVVDGEITVIKFRAQPELFDIIKERAA